MPKRFIQIVSIGPTDIVLWINDQKYDFSAPADVIKHFLFVQRHNQGKALAYLKEHCNKSWNVTDEAKFASKEILGWRTLELGPGARVRIHNVDGVDEMDVLDGKEGTVTRKDEMTENLWHVKLDIPLPDVQDNDHVLWTHELELI